MLLAAFVDKYGEKYSSKISYIRFGISGFESIDAYHPSKKNQYNKCVFCIGYSGVRAHQHLKVIDVFGKLSDDMKQKIFLLIPMTYATPTGYYDEVKKSLDASGIEYKILTNYMDNEKMAEMWCNTNYFVNAQTTDSLSASILESIYAGCKLINPIWLSYPEYEEFGINYIPYDNFNTLYNIIVDILNTDKYTLITNDIKKIYDGMSWKASRKAWEQILQQD